MYWFIVKDKLNVGDKVIGLEKKILLNNKVLDDKIWRKQMN